VTEVFYGLGLKGAALGVRVLREMERSADMQAALL
jgi:hypothetical protein